MTITHDLFMYDVFLNVFIIKTLNLILYLIKLNKFKKMLVRFIYIKKHNIKKYKINIKYIIIMKIYISI